MFIVLLVLLVVVSVGLGVLIGELNALHTYHKFHREIEKIIEEEEAAQNVSFS